MTAIVFFFLFFWQSCLTSPSHQRLGAPISLCAPGQCVLCNLIKPNRIHLIIYLFIFLFIPLQAKRLIQSAHSHLQDSETSSRRICNCSDADSDGVGVDGGPGTGQNEHSAAHLQAGRPASSGGNGLQLRCERVAALADAETVALPAGEAPCWRLAVWLANDGP